MSLVLACIVHKLRQDNIGLIQTRQVVHLMSIMVATFEHLSVAQPNKKLLLFLFTLLKNKAFFIFCFLNFSLVCIDFLNVPWKLLHHHNDSMSYLNFLKIGWWSRPFCYVAKMVLDEGDILSTRSVYS